MPPEIEPAPEIDVQTRSGASQPPELTAESVSSDPPQAAQADPDFGELSRAEPVTADESAQPVVSPPAQPAETHQPEPVEGQAEPKAEDSGEPAEPPVEAEAEDTVPLARLKGVQRQLSAVEKDRDSFKAMSAALKEQLTAAEKRAAVEYTERIRATRSDIVPSLIRGETVEQVEQSLNNSKAAFAAAQQAYARQIPTPQVGSGAPQAPAQPKSPLQLIRDGLSAPKQDINT